MIHEKFGELKWEHTWNSSEYDRLLGCFQTRYPNAIAMARLSSERKPHSIPPTQVVAHTLIVDFTTITDANSDNNPHFLRVMHGRLDDLIPDNCDVEIGGQCYFECSFCSLLFSLILTLSKLDPVQMASAQVFRTFTDN